MDSSEQKKEARQVALVSHPLHALEGKHRVPLWISLMTFVRVSRWALKGRASSPTRFLFNRVGTGAVEFQL